MTLTAGACAARFAGVSPAFELPVSCACASPLWRTVLGTEELQNLGQRVLACMSCGAVDAVVHATEPIPDHPHDAVRVVGYTRIALTEPERTWLGAWPRRVGDPHAHPRHPGEVFFLPASARFADVSSLHQAEQHARRHGAERYAERLRAAGVPSEPPPAGTVLRFTFWFFGETWSALAPAEGSSSDELRAGADALHAPASWCYEARVETPNGD